MKTGGKKFRTAAAFLPALILALLFLANRNLFYTAMPDGTSAFMKKDAALYFLMTGLSLLFLFLPNRLGQRARTVIGGLLMLAVPCLNFLMAERVMMTGYDVMTSGKFKIVMNLAYYLLAELFFYAISLNFGIAFFSGAVFSGVFATVNVYLMDFAGMPLYATDLTAARTAGNVLENYHLYFTSGILLVIAYAVLIWCVSHWLRPGRKHKAFVRILAVLLFAALAFFAGDFTMHSQAFKKHGVSISSFRPLKSYKKNGGLLTFARSFCRLEVDKPEGYDTESLGKDLEEYQSDPADGGGFKEPNVIVIMDEAFSDLQTVGDFETNQDVLPFLHSLTENTEKGDAYVSVWGGHTANTEYEFLSGDSYAFAPSGTTPYLLYIKDYFPTLVSTLEEAGYAGNLAVHPFLPSGYNRERVYGCMGFERFLSLGDFNGAPVVRNYVSDQADFDRLIQEYEASRKESDAPFFAFNVTMQNHSGYDEDFDNLPGDIQITTPGVGDVPAVHYLNLAHLTDAALKNLIGYFDSIDDPTVIVLFGDHQPKMTGEFYASILGQSKGSLSEEESMKLYKVPFIIHANFDIPESEGEKISMNYLHARMEELTGMRMTAYDKYLNDLRKKIPVINALGYYGEDGKFYSLDDKTSPYREDILRYHQICYNHLFDKKNRLNGFFELAG